jgi:oligopeptide transport system ATP-binding protein
VAEPLKTHNLCDNAAQRRERARELLAWVGINEEQMNRYPHEFSGGQQQRVGIARTLAVQPEFIICDEPISALDVSIQSQIINMLEDMQQELGLTYLFIAHDVSVVRHISRRIGVMFLGCLVELAPSDELVHHPLHPYTQTLMSAVPIPDPDVTRAKKRILLQGELPSPIDPPPGCRFASRCPYAKDCGGRCTTQRPPLKEVSPGHFVACWLME